MSDSLVNEFSDALSRMSHRKLKETEGKFHHSEGKIRGKSRHTHTHA